MKKTIIYSITILLAGFVSAFTLNSATDKKNANPFRVMFYNVENLYDTENDPNIDDEEFLPGSESNWTNERLNVKLANIAQVIKAVGRENMPDVIGFSEIENKKVLEYLLAKTDLNKDGYSIVHYDSPDKRGIDVGLIYRKDRFKVINSKKIPVIFPDTSERPTRDILYVKGELPNKSVLHVLVNHWPSRSGGQPETEPKRIQAAKKARHICDSLQATDKNANIILIGDFNDYPTDKSITEILAAVGDTTSKTGNLYDLMTWQNAKGKGSHQYRGEWGFLDQIIVSAAIINGNKNLKTYFNQATVFKADFLIEINEKFKNEQPKRTYGGKNYIGGYSDHLPVYVDLWMN